MSAADFGGNTAKRTVTYTVKKFPRCNGKRATILAKKGKPTKGTPGPDVIVGTAGNDRIDGRGGNDVKDKLAGGPGRDTERQ